jgi:uncharacterized OB-fold protein
MFQRCDDCGAAVFPPEAACTACLSHRLTWTRSSGRGRVHTYTVVHRGQQPSFATPYVPGVVELEEGWYMLTNIVGCRADEVRVGQAVEVTFERVTDDITLPKFRPVDRHD